jgi:hypothetical protein
MARIIKSNTQRIRSFELHPAAKPAIDFFHSIPPQFDFLPMTFRQLSCTHSAIRGVICDDRFLMFDPVCNLRLWDGNRPPMDCELIGYKVGELSDQKITTITWINILQTVFNSIGKNNGLLNLHQSFNRYLPTNIKQHFDLKRVNLSERELAKWAGVSPGTIPEQKRQQEKIVENYQGDIFGEVRKTPKST